MTGTQLHELTALEQGSLVRERVVSSRELVDHHLARIDRLNASLSTLVCVGADHAREAAARFDADGHDQPSPLAGVPYAVKDLTPMGGLPTTFGSRAVPPTMMLPDAPVVRASRAAGLLPLGKTNTPEFGATCYTANDLLPETPTPWDLGRSASGSSGGAAAAVSARLVPVAHATDGAGSTRTPAASCGVVGIKPTRGILDRPTASFIDVSTDGAIARTVTDAVALVDAMASTDAWLPGLADPPARINIAVTTDPGVADTPAAASLVTAVEQAAARLEELGHTVTPIDNPLGPDGVADLLDPLLDLFAIAVSAAAHAVGALNSLERLRPYTRFLVDRARQMSLMHGLAAQERLLAAARRQVDLTDAYDVVLSPPTTDLARPLGFFSRPERPVEEARAMLAWSAFTPVANLSGAPSVTLPTGAVSPKGLPLSVLLTGRPGQDRLLVRLAAQMEATLPRLPDPPVH